MARMETVQYGFLKKASGCQFFSLKCQSSPALSEMSVIAAKTGCCDVDVIQEIVLNVT